jgi:hypothetical protein
MSGSSLRRTASQQPLYVEVVYTVSMSMTEAAPYLEQGMSDRYMYLFGEEHGLRVYGKHRYDTFEFTERFPDQLILRSALARYALFAMRPIPARQHEDVALAILGDKHPFNLSLKVERGRLRVSTHEEMMRHVAMAQFGQELLAGEARVFGVVSDGVPKPDMFKLIAAVTQTIEDL